MAANAHWTVDAASRCELPPTNADSRCRGLPIPPRRVAAHSGAMNVAFRPHGVVIRPPHFVELDVTADDHVVRAIIEWGTLERILGRPIRDKADVEQFLHAHRRDIALAIKARLFARGIPIAQELVLSAGELEALRGSATAPPVYPGFPTPAIKTSLQPSGPARR